MCHNPPVSEDAQQTVAIALDDDERALLVAALSDWSGPASGSEALALAMGFSSLGNLFDETSRMSVDIQDLRPMSTLDWTRALLATEIAFASSVLGTGVEEWLTIRGGTSDVWISALRRLQTKLPADPTLLPS
jgi:hypothetical protein